MFDNGRVLLELRDTATVIGGCVDAPVYGLPDTDLVGALDAVQALKTTLATVEAHLVREMDGRDLPRQHGAPNTAAWLAGRYRIGFHAARNTVTLAKALDTSPVLDQAMAAGEV